jgi:hypothetical protein
MLIYSFVWTGTNKPYEEIPVFYFTFSDLDERHGGKESEQITVYDFMRYYTNDDLQISEETGVPGNGHATFASSDYGNYQDNNMNVDSPEPTQLSKAVTFKFLNKWSFRVRFSVPLKFPSRSKPKDRKGRNILFSGISQLVFCQEESVYLNLKNSRVIQSNLGGRGPDQGAHELRYENVATYQNEQLDLVVTADENYGYTPWNTTQNGLHGDFGHVNLWSGPSQEDSEAYLFFTVMRSGTNDMVTLPAFAFVLFDFDMGLHEKQIEYVEIRPNQPGFL